MNGIIRIAKTYILIIKGQAMFWEGGQYHIFKFVIPAHTS